jgi:hypothetical protein
LEDGSKSVYARTNGRLFRLTVIVPHGVV